jgi:hypothetical protein
MIQASAAVDIVERWFLPPFPHLLGDVFLGADHDFADRQITSVETADVLATFHVKPDQ